MENLRDGYGFTIADKQFARDRANGHCEFPAGCPRPNTNKVNHITGVYEAKVTGMTKESVSDIKLNSVMLCKPHEAHHDLQEAQHIQRALDRSTRIFPSPFNAGEIIWRRQR